MEFVVAVVVVVVVVVFLIFLIMGAKDRAPRSPKPKSEREKIREALERECGTDPLPVKVLTIDDAIRLSRELGSEGVYISAAQLLSRARTGGFRTASSQKSRYGDINPTAECIFCGVTGGVRVKIASVTEEYRMNSAAGAALGVGLNAQKDKVQRQCDKCSKTWHE